MRILIVDDEESTRYYLKRLIIKKFGFKVKEASNGIEALDSIQKEQPDIVFLDISMPQMDGIECLRQIRRDPKTDDLPVVIMTAHNDATTVNEFLQLGIFAYILKPFGYYQTFDKLKEILGGLKSRSEQKKKEKPEDKLLAGIKKQKIVIADSDPSFRTFFKQLLNNQFRIAEAKDEIECSKAALNNNPDLIIISDNVKTKNETDLISQLRKTNTSSNLKIFLCRDINESFKTRQSLFDGVIQKSFLTDSFMREFSIKVLNYSSLFAYMQQIFKTYIQYEVINSVKSSLQLKSENEIKILENFDVNSLENKVLSKAELIAAEDDFVLNIGIVGDEPDAENLVRLLKSSPNKLNESSHPHLNYVCFTIASQIRLAIERFGIKTIIDSPAIKNLFLNTFYSYWEIVIPIRIDEKRVLVVGVNLEKKD